MTSYRVGQAPTLAVMKEHNRSTWRRLAALLDKTGRATLQQLSAEALGHVSGQAQDQSKSPQEMAEGFVEYGIDRGWLVIDDRPNLPPTSSERPPSVEAQRKDSSTYLVPWSSAHFSWPDDVLDALLRNGPTLELAVPWRSDLHARVDDRMFYVRVDGPSLRLFGSGRATRHSSEQSPFAAAVDVAWDHFVDPRVAGRCLDVTDLLSGIAVPTREIELSPGHQEQIGAAWEVHLQSLDHGVQPAPSRLERLGLPYTDVGRVPATVRRDPFDVDPDVIDRGNQAHAATQDQLAAFLRDHALAPRAPGFDEPAYDLAWELADETYVAEVKSITASNEESQLRLGLGQVLWYRHRLAATRKNVVAVLVSERQPTNLVWADVCASIGVLITWPGAFARLLANEKGVELDRPADRH